MKQADKQNKSDKRRPSELSELVPVIHVRIVVFGDHHSVGKLASGESLHGFLTFCGGNVLHKDLQRQKPVGTITLTFPKSR